MNSLVIQSRVTLLVWFAFVTQGNFSKDVVVIAVVIVVTVEDEKKVMDILLFITMGRNDIVKDYLETA